MALESIAGLDRKARPFARETGSSCFSTPAPSSRSCDILGPQRSSDWSRSTFGAEELYVLVAQLAELSDWCIANEVPVRERIEEVKSLANIIPLDEDICLEESRLKNERRRRCFGSFGFLDGLLL